VAVVVATSGGSGFGSSFANATRSIARSPIVVFNPCGALVAAALAADSLRARGNSASNQNIINIIIIWLERACTSE
jgi:hypothetical protein